MAPFFSRITGKDRSASTAGAPVKGVPTTPDYAGSIESLPSTSSSTINPSAPMPSPPEVIVSGGEDDEDDSTPSGPVARTTSSPYGVTTSMTPSYSANGSTGRKAPPSNITAPAQAHKSASPMSESEFGEIMTPTATSQFGGSNSRTGLPPPPGLTVEDSDHTVGDTTIQNIPSRKSSLASITLQNKASGASLRESKSAKASERRARRSSVASSDDGSVHRQGTTATITPGTVAVNHPAPSPAASQLLNRASSIPTSSLLAAPGNDIDSASIRSGVSSSGKKKRLFSKNKGGPGPGGIAGALAQSGMSIAYTGAGIHVPAGTPVMPGAAGTASPPRRTASRHGPASHVPRTSIDSVLLPRRESLSQQGPPRLSEDNPQTMSPDEYDEMYESPDALSFDEDDIPVTGFAVASSKRNADFHELFPDVEEGDYLIEDYGCAMQRDILVQGRLYISENHLCFHANIFGWVTNVTIAFADVIAIDKKMTAFVIPNAIQISTRSTKYTFASFITRDTSYDVITNIWRLASPRRPNDDEQSLRSNSLDGANAGAQEATEAKEVKKQNRVTECGCGKRGEHFDTVMMDCVMPGTPQQIHTLMWTSGFIKDFMSNNQKLTEIQTSDWAPQKEGSHLLSRTLSYIKPLNNSLGPRSTKCEIVDETSYADFEDYISILTITRTPNVPSGSAFSVKTRTCLMWASSASTRIKVTSFIDWTGRSYIKSMIEKGAMEGQRSWHDALEAAMRAYINQHRSEFFPAGEEVPDVSDTQVQLDTPLKTPGPDSLSPEEQRKVKQRETEAKGLQWALDTFNGAWNVGKQSASGAIDILGDMIEFSSSTSLLVFVVIILVLSNLWTMSSLKSVRKEQAKSRYQMRMNEAIQPVPPGFATPGSGGDSEALRSLLESIIARPTTTTLAVDPSALPFAPAEELKIIQESLASLSKRVTLLAEKIETSSESEVSEAHAAPEIEE